MKNYNETIELMNNNFGLFIEVDGEEWREAKLFNDATDEEYPVSIETCEELQANGVISETHGGYDSEKFDYVQGFDQILRNKHRQR